MSSDCDCVDILLSRAGALGPATSDMVAPAKHDLRVRMPRRVKAGGPKSPPNTDCEPVPYEYRPPPLGPMLGEGVMYPKGA